MNLPRQTRALTTGRRDGGTVWFTGLPAAGKSTLARAVECELLKRGMSAYVLDGDNLRHGLTGDLGFVPEDRAENVRRVAHVAAILADAGVIALVALISPYAADRQGARDVHQRAGCDFLEVWVDTPLAVCERRDPKGLYRSARRGEIVGFTGVDAPYEEPADAELRLRSLSVRQAVHQLICALEVRGLAGRSVESESDPGSRSELTLREREILALVELGLTNKEIARRLSIAPSTVKNHVHHILNKLQVHCRGQAVALARTAADRSEVNASR